MILIHYTPNGAQRITDMTDVYKGQTAILSGAAPSLKTQPLQLLTQRGVLTMAMNNAAIHFRPNLWCGVDHPSCFDPQILLDPGIVKFGNFNHADAVAQTPAGDIRYRDFPNTHFYVPEAEVPWDEYLEQRRSVPWYNNTLFTAIHVLYQLGVRRIILAGSDFAVSDTGAMYAHASELDALQTKWNVNLYNNQVYELRRLKPLFDQAELELLDCSVNSRIRQVYRHVTMDEAVGLCLEHFPKTPAPPSTLPHCSAFAPEGVKARVAAWPGYAWAEPLTGKEQ